jgi:hypothetical protein
LPASDGQGVGGAIFVDADALLGLDTYTLAGFRRNNASTRGNDVAGAYQVII